MNRLKNQNKHIGSINFCIPGTMSRCGAGTTCYRMNKAIPNFYLARNLQPVWYEREDNDDFRLDANGLKIVRYDIPMELQDLAKQ